MKISYGIPKKLTGNRIITIGNFDGVHKGHKSLLTTCKNIAHQEGFISSVLTFHPHPNVFFKSKSHHCLQGLRDKTTEIKATGVDELIILPFQKKLANYSAIKFVKEILNDNLNVKTVIIGEDFKFGKNKSGNAELLQKTGEELGFKTIIIESILGKKHKISSSYLRKLAMDGDIEELNVLRGGNLTISGHVLHGKKLGRKLGFPTLNINVPNNHCMSGIYIASVKGLDSKNNQKSFPAIASLGRRPTVENYGKLLLEVYVLDWSKSVYGKLVTTKLHKKIRDEIKFKELNKMRQQMVMDEIATRKFFK